ncbi:hypothetical protein HMPREF1139_0025 [Campylobacter sp. FOBRC14]|nr:hypothetical protein HMPREF1139_0025 [Campylobacter sp. FOBRC14]
MSPYITCVEILTIHKNGYNIRLDGYLGFIKSKINFSLISRLS